MLRVDAQGHTSIEATVSCCLHGQHNSQKPSLLQTGFLTIPGILPKPTPPSDSSLSFPTRPHPLHTCTGAPQLSSPLARGGGTREGCCKGADVGMFPSKEPLSGSPTDHEPRSMSPCAPAAVWQPFLSGVQVQPSCGLFNDWQACT